MTARTVDHVARQSLQSSDPVPESGDALQIHSATRLI